MNVITTQYFKQYRKELGFTNVKYLKKGFKNWTKKDYPIVK